MPRTPGFRREDVIEAAKAIFWDRGYSQTSVADLVAATGLKPGSLYAAFGSKKGIYLEVLDAYHRSFMRRIGREKRHESGAFAGLIRIFQAMIDDAATGRDRRGCLAVNGMLEMSQHDADIARRLSAHNEATRAALADLVRTAQAQRDIDPGRDPEEIAAFLERWLPRYRDNNRSYVTIALGCTGGQHRSVYLAEKLYRKFREHFPEVNLRHRELQS